ncbi:LOW QUALITY PROTEIN: GATOR2 complex protein MIOS [Culicoides brevitarsis]|uniref:LOW QUALITY PROTEIN: GATOR2 complex protein MIOS n=1 Tax=Culicoides brevitarsis TaxID=469753 RepID=UPI00307B541D
MGSIYWIKDTADKFLIATENIVKIYKEEEKSYKLVTTENRYKDILQRTITTAVTNETDNRFLVAFGLLSSKFVVWNSGNPETPLELPEARQISCLDFKGSENKIAVGYEKTKNYCVSFWDLNRSSPYIVSSVCSSDGVTSLSWDPEYKQLITGLSSKHIRVYDSRQLDKNPLTISTKHTPNGIKCSSNGYHILSYADNSFVVHDLRFFDKTFAQIMTAKSIHSALWSPMTSNTVGVIQGDHLLYLYEHINEDSEPYLRTCAPLGKLTKHAITSFTFAQGADERCLFHTTNSNIVEYVVPQKHAVQFDVKQNSLMLNTVRDVKLIAGTMKDEEEDISQIMQKRALKDYGLIADIKENGDLSLDPKLKSVWDGLSLMYEKGCMLGLKSILGIKDGSTIVPKSESEFAEWYDHPTFEARKVYKSEHRTKAILLCGWNVQDDGNSEVTLTKNGYHESCKAALIACFHLKLKQAVEILSKSHCESPDQSNVLRISAIVLENFNPDKHNPTNLLEDIKEPYLKAIFAFLNKDYEYILEDTELPLSDRMGFALKYLSDSSLTDFINNQIKKCIEIGDLSGILMAGSSIEGVSLLQAYVDISDDIQSVALIASRFFTSEPFRIQYWIQTYRDMLDGWNLFDQRAQLDIMMNSKTTRPKAIQLLCNFCGKSISSGFQEENRVRFLINKISSCPHCRKTLTRCSLCMLHLGTCSTDFTDKNSKKATAIFQAKPFSNWFSWCQTCRHGGHMKHLLTWFAQNSVCPVTDCNCCCSNIDKTLFSNKI